MSAYIEILDKGNKSEFNIAIRTQNITFWTSDSRSVIGFTFDMSDETHRQAIKTMIEVLQQQLEIHEGK